jgi:outer membrane protein assembly factor BamD (BamD/ComL family)
MSALTPVLMCLLSGCASLPGGGFTPPWKNTETAKVDGPKDQITLTAGGMKHEVVESAAQQELEGAKRLLEEKKFALAEPIFHKLANMQVEPKWWEVGVFAPAEAKSDAPDADGYKGKRVTTKNRSRSLNPVTEAALFYEAECQRLQKNYRTAVDTYTKLLVEVPHSQYTQRTCQGLFEIADYWLEPTRRQMDEYQEQLKGQRWFVTPASYIHFSDDMPLLDTEGHATIVLNTVRLHDIRGPLGEKALLYLGTINFYRQDYKEADFYFTQLKDEYKDGPYAAKAVKQSVICKQLMTGGSIYDCRGVEESKKLLMRAQGWYPELAKEDEWIRMQLTSINIQQADRDFKVAEFYQRTGHPGSAYFYYELVCRRYPRTDYASKAEQRKVELKAKVEKEQKASVDAPTAPTSANPVVQGPSGSFVPPPPPRTLPPGLDR